MVLEHLFPSTCPVCARTIASPHGLCGTCWEALQFLSAPECRTCGLPLSPSPGDDPACPPDHLLCGTCAHTPPVYLAHRAALAYDETSRQLILPFKHGDRMESQVLLSRLLLQRIHSLPVAPDLIVPVPLHRWRLLKRRYNQAALLSARLARDLSVRHAPDLLRRVRATESQGHLTPEKRARNVRGAFSVHPPERVSDRNILVIDDVFTTGVTLNECAETLLKAGAGSVCALTVARVVRPG